MGNKPQFVVKSRPSKTPQDKEFNFKKLLKKWKNKYQEFGIREELVRRQEFKKPSVLKREMMNTTIRNNKREVQKEKENN